jgi:pilus assembly protein CpaB
MKSKSIILLAVSLGFGLVAAFGISQVLGRGGGTTEAPQIVTKPVVIAKETLEIHSQLIEGENVEIANWQEDLVPETALASIEELEDQLSRVRVPKNMPILQEYIVHKNEANIIEIPPGHSVFAINVSNDDLIGGLLSPGDHVNILGVFQAGGSTIGSVVSRTFMKNVKVFSVDANTASDTDRNNAGAAVVGVLVTQKEAEKIVLVQQIARLKLILVGKDDPENNGENEDYTTVANIFGADPGTRADRRLAANERLHSKPRTMFDNGNDYEMMVHTQNGPKKFVWKNGQSVPVEESLTSPPASNNGEKTGGPGAIRKPSSNNNGGESRASNSGSVGGKSIDEFDE